MVVTKIVSVTKTKYAIYIDEMFAFELYKGEMKQFGLLEGKTLENEQLLEMKQIVVKRAKLRALHLLNDMDRTESQLRQKLRQNRYPEDVVEAAMQYVSSFGYLGDDRYAVRFIEQKQSVKSKREIQAALLGKGIDKATIDLALEQCYEAGDERKAIRRLLDKKNFSADIADDKTKKKMFDYLLRKGFRYEDIRQEIQVSDGNA